MKNADKILYPIKWRARVSKDNTIILKFFVQNNQTVDINLPIHQLKQITQIFREILGRPIGKAASFMDWKEVIFQFEQEKSKIKMLTNKEKSKVGFGIETPSGIKAEIEISVNELKNLIKLSNEQLSKLEN